MDLTDVNDYPGVFLALTSNDRLDDLGEAGRSGGYRAPPAVAAALRRYVEKTGVEFRGDNLLKGLSD